MKRRENELRIFLALLPVLGHLHEPAALALPVAAAAGGSLVFVCFFRLTRPLFPPRLFIFSVCLAAAVFFESLRMLFGISLLWAASFYLLLDFGDFSATGRSGLFLRRLAGTSLRAMLFTLLAALLALMTRTAEAQPGFAFWGRPVGVFFLLAAAALLLRLQQPFPRKAAARETMPEADS